MNRAQTVLTARISGVFTLLLVVAIVSGCATLQSQFERPKVQLANVTFLEGGLLEQVYAVTLHVDNPNGYTLPIKGLSYALKLGGQDFASGVTPNAFSIPANGSEQISIQVRTNLLQTIGHLSRLLSDNAQSLDYEMSGRVKINLPLIGEIPFSQSGTIPLQTPQNSASEII